MNASTLLTRTAAIAALVLVPGATLAADVAAGKAAYTANCSSCHGETGKGDGPVGAVLQPPPRDLSLGEFKFDTDSDGTPGTDTDLQEVITKGAGAFGGNQMMAPWGGVLSADDVTNIIAYIRSLKQ
jgi:mono/diheme cytochrome c family protein